MSDSFLSIFDTRFALNQLSGNQTLLIQILEKFIKQYQQFDTFLLESLQQPDFQATKFQATKMEIHTIKGVSGNLGMTALHHECKELEVKLANEANENSAKAFLKVLAQTLTLVQDYLTENNVVLGSDDPQVQDDKTLLIAALKRSEFISERKMQNFAKSLNFSPEKLTELKQAIENLEYNNAIQLLEQ